MNRTFVITCLSAFLAVSASAEFEANAKRALRETATRAQARLKAAEPFGSKAITLLPVKGDDGGYFERLLTGAFVGAGRTLVVSNDEQKDERFKRILKEIRWDEAQMTLKSIDPVTLDALGRLKSTQIFVEARLDVVKRKSGRFVVELNLLAYEIATKRFIWSENLVVDEAEGQSSGIKVKLETAYNGDSSSSAAALLHTEVKQQLLDLGLVVDGAGDPDILVKLTVLRTVFDTTGAYQVFDGTLRVSAQAQGTAKRLLGEKTISARGERGLGEMAADKNLVVKLAEETGKWAKATLSPTALRVNHPDFVKSIAE